MGLTGSPGVKGAKGEPGQSISAPSLLQRPVEMTVNESQTAMLKCTAVVLTETEATFYANE